MEKIDVVLKNIIERIPYYIFWKNRESVYLGCNQRFLDLIGKKSALEIIGKTDFDLGWGTGEPDSFRKGDQDVMNGNPRINVEEILVRPDGEEIVMLVSKVPLRDEHNNCVGVLGISTNITERKKAEQELLHAKEKAEQANISKSRFLAMASHELRTPLNGILGFSDLLSETTLSSQQKEFVGFIKKSGEHLLSIITDVLDFTKLEVKKQTAQMENFEIKSLVKEAVATTKHLVEDKPLLLLVTEFDDALPNIISSDPFKIKQIVINLISNAIKFTHKGFVKVKVGCDYTNEKNAVLKISVQDTGIGIPQEKLELVFKEFEQAEGGLYMRRYGGMGLGLAICRQFADLLQGKIWVESIVEQGSTFHFEIPIEVIQTNASPDKRAAIILPEKKPSAHARVLSVEDNPIAQKMMVFMLTNLGYKPDTAITAQETLEKLSYNTYDIVFMDIQLPDGSGDKITKAIREGDGPNKNTTIIALTAHVYPNEKASFLASGMNAVMEKPMAKESLAEEIEAVMRRV